MTSTRGAQLILRALPDREHLPEVLFGVNAVVAGRTSEDATVTAWFCGRFFLKNANPGLNMLSCVSLGPRQSHGCVWLTRNSSGTTQLMQVLPPALLD